MQAYKSQYDQWAREQKKLGIDVPPCEPPKAPPDPTAAGTTSKIAERYERKRKRKEEASMSDYMSYSKRAPAPFGVKS